MSSFFFRLFFLVDTESMKSRLFPFSVLRTGFYTMPILKISRFPTSTSIRELCTTQSDRLGVKTRSRVSLFFLTNQLSPFLFKRTGPKPMPAQTRELCTTKSDRLGDKTMVHFCVVAFLVSEVSVSVPASQGYQSNPDQNKLPVSSISRRICPGG